MPQNEEKPTTPPEAPDYIKIIADLKASSIDRAAYEKLKSERDELLKTLVDGGQITNGEKETPNIEELRKEIYGSDGPLLSNLEYCKKTLQLRDALKQKTGRDPFCPFGHKVTPDEEDIRAAERVASVLRDCIEYANGDSQVFTNELQRRMIDTAPMRKRK